MHNTNVAQFDLDDKLMRLKERKNEGHETGMLSISDFQSFSPIASTNFEFYSPPSFSVNEFFELLVSHVVQHFHSNFYTLRNKL